jgi:hypothetical protein
MNWPCRCYLFVPSTGKETANTRLAAAGLGPENLRVPLVQVPGLQAWSGANIQLSEAEREAVMEALEDIPGGECLEVSDPDPRLCAPRWAEALAARNLTPAE